MRVISWLEGKLYANVQPQTATLQHSLGALLAHSLLLSAQSYAASPDNEYLLISAQPAWAPLEFLHDFGRANFRAAL